ncbi:MAG: hypothetical protein MI923_02800 [Phycisphaerales bacterium]|nr:hypothetical protein [Phycisphaerales bacterium]
MLGSKVGESRPLITVSRSAVPSFDVPWDSPPFARTQTMGTRAIIAGADKPC